jgi:hypothetical protein
MTQNKFSVVTTFNADGYDQYGRRMIETFLQNWPADVVLRVYAENCRVTQTASNLHVFDLNQASQELIAFKTKWNNVPKANGDVSADPVRSLRKDAGKGFKWDAIRFSHKVYAIFHAAKNCNSEVLIWMDADMVCHSHITTEKLNYLIPENSDLCYLGRKGKFTECGLYSMNLRSPMVKTFLQEFQRMYDNAEHGIFHLDEWHDSFVFDAVRARMPFLQQVDWSNGIVTGEGHPLINSEWGAYLDHLKGDRKSLGRSKPKDLKVNRQEKYWQ